MTEFHKVTLRPGRRELQADEESQRIGAVRGPRSPRGARILDLLCAVTREHATATVLVTHDTALLDGADRAC